MLRNLLDALGAIAMFFMVSLVALGSIPVFLLPPQPIKINIVSSMITPLKVLIVVLLVIFSNSALNRLSVIFNHSLI